MAASAESKGGSQRRGSEPPFMFGAHVGKSERPGSRHRREYINVLRSHHERTYGPISNISCCVSGSLGRKRTFPE